MVHGVQTRTCSTGGCKPDSSGISTKERTCLLENCTLIIDASFRDTRIIYEEINIFDNVENASNRKVLVKIHKDMILIAPSINQCAINSGGPFKELTIKVNGLVFGKSGDGGQGGGFKEWTDGWFYSTIPSLDGENGKHGEGMRSALTTLRLRKKTEIKNSGRVFGGRSGGGGTCAGYRAIRFGYPDVSQGQCAKGGARWSWSFYDT